MEPYFNDLTTPTGRCCKIFEVTNGEYLTMLKFLNAGNKGRFLKIFGSILERGIEEYAEMDIVEKAYAAIGFIFYNIRPEINLRMENMGDIPVGLTVFLDNIEKAYEMGREVACPLEGGLTVIVSYPKDYDIDEEGNILLDYLGGITAVEKCGKRIALTPQMRSQLIEKLGERERMIVSETAREGLFNQVNLAKGFPHVDYTVNLVSGSLVETVCQMFREPLESFYNLEYLMAQYVRVPRGDFMEMTPLEAQVVLRSFIEDKQKQNEELKKQGGS